MTPPRQSSSWKTNAVVVNIIFVVAIISAFAFIKLRSDSSSGEPADDSSSPSSPAASGSRSSGSGSGSAAGGAPDGITGITLTGAFADTANYTIATGTWADVPGDSSTVALDGFTSTANAAKATQGVIYVGG
ncbi:hypothetical protein JCM21900_004894 [Sporobolomyces salmonicolor]